MTRPQTWSYPSNAGRLRVRLQAALAGLALLSLVAGCRVFARPAAKPQPSPAVQPLAATQAAPTATPEPEETMKPEDFKVVGYVADWAGMARDVQYDRLTHINYAFLLPNPDGTVVKPKNTPKMEKVIAAAHERGVKVLISVGGWGYDSQFELLAADPAARARFVEQVTAFVRTYKLDGADIDWEYPDPDPTPTNSAQNFVDLMRELNAALRPEGKLLTAAVVAIGLNADAIKSEAFAYMDFVNIMVYDKPGEQHSPYSYAEEAMDYWRGRGLPREKAILGVPFYGRPHELSYKRLVQLSPTAPFTDRVEYLGDPVYYNGIPIIRQKTELAMRRGAGIMIWVVTYDTNDETSLLKAIHDTVYGGQ